MDIPFGRKYWVGEGTPGSEGVLHDIIKMTEEWFTVKNFPAVLNDPKLAQKYRHAFIEHVYLLMRGHLRFVAAKNAVANRLKPVITSNVSCKGDVDRGTSAKLPDINAFLDEEYADMRLGIHASINARALSSEERTILAHRVHPNEAHVELVPPSVSRNHLERLCGLSPDSISFIPAL